MRRVLVDHSRAISAKKRGGARSRVTLDDDLGSSPEGLDLVDLSDSLDRLATLNNRHAKVVELRILGGLTIAEAAQILDVSHATIETDWFTAKCWLRRELGCAQ